jgi:hypothetical protein
LLSVFFSLKVTEIAKARRGHVRGNTAPDVIEQLRHVETKPPNAPSQSKVAQKVKLKKWFQRKGLSVI